MTDLTPLISPSGVLIHTSPERVEDLMDKHGYRAPLPSNTEPIDLTPKSRRRRKTDEQ